MRSLKPHELTSHNCGSFMVAAVSVRSRIEHKYEPNHREFGADRINRQS